MNWKTEYKTVWKQLSDKVSLEKIHQEWVNISIDDFWWKIWGNVCDSYRQVIWAYLMKYFNIDGWQKYKQIIDDYEKGLIIVNYDGKWRKYDKNGDFIIID